MKALLSITLFLLVLVGTAQPVRITIPGSSDLFTTDELGNVYVLRGDVLELYDNQGKSWLRNSVKTFGRIGAVDAFYSLKPMLFSVEQGQVAVLDNTLSVQGSVLELPRNGFAQVTLACMSVQNSFWFFDARDMALMRVDAQLRELANTGRLDQLLGVELKPIAMHEHDSRLYVNDPAEGILVFDLYGTYVKTIPIKGANTFEVRGQALFFFADGKLQVYDMRSFDVMDWNIPEPPSEPVLDARVERNRVYLRLADRILVQEMDHK